MTESPVEIHRADPRLRRVAVITVAALLLIGAFALWMLQRWLAELAHAAPSMARPQLLAAMAWLIGISCALLLALAVYFWRAGAQVRVAGRFPAPGERMLRDTRVLHGPVARRRATVLQGIGVALAICSLGLASSAWRLYLALASHVV